MLHATHSFDLWMKYIPRAPPELMLCYLCYFDFFQYEWQIGFVDMLVFLSQPTELP